ncbi:hypothetical protein [Mycobacterium tuberculosis]|uniref:hypothetical protein n=1 Tax=Mycobacterium tuberculosis TaxID=1773 RepID=UPI00214D6A38|nr:hypothetical protein [Mycobacterium tuberculosis]
MTAYQFDDLMISEEENYALGVERRTGKHYISVDVIDGDSICASHYEISEAEFTRLLDDPASGQALARRCKAGEEETRLIREG